MAQDAGADYVRCYGIAKAGENDCADAAAAHSCAGQARMDYSGTDWKKKDTVEDCAAAGGSTKPFMGIATHKERG